MADHEITPLQYVGEMTATEVRDRMERMEHIVHPPVLVQHDDMMDAQKYAMDVLNSTPPLKFNWMRGKLDAANVAAPDRLAAEQPNDVIEYKTWDILNDTPRTAYQYTGRYVKAQIMDALDADLQDKAPNESRRALESFEIMFPSLKRKLDKILGDGKI